VIKKTRAGGGGAAGGGDSFTLVQPDTGTSPAAGGSDTLVVAGGAGIETSGDSSTDTLTITNKLTNGVIGIVIDGGGSVLTTGVKGYVEAPFSGTINGWTIVADQSGSCVVDVWKDTYANFPPEVAETIAGTEKPTLSSAQKNQDLTLSTWTTAVTKGDILAFNVDSAATVTRVTVQLRITRSS
jgi:hypothetical protein